MNALHRVATLSASVALLLSGCGGSGGVDVPPPPPPAAAWGVPQIAPFVASGAFRVYSDGADGVFVVGPLTFAGATGGGFQMARFAATTGWSSQATALPALEDIQEVALDDGVAIFGRDATNWYRTDYTRTGVTGPKVQFAVGGNTAPPISGAASRFTRSFDGTIVAYGVVSDTSTTPPKAKVQTREFQQGAWTSAQTTDFSRPDNGGSELAFFTQLDLVRAKGGDVMRVSVGPLCNVTYIALRRPTEATFVGMSPVASDGGSRCGVQAYTVPQLALDGTATVTRVTRGLGYEWLAIQPSVVNPLVTLWQPGQGLAGEFPIINQLDTAGLPTWLTVASGGGFSLWQGAVAGQGAQSAARAVWTANPQALNGCVAAAACVALSKPDTTHIATIARVAPNSAKFYVSDRDAAGQWAQAVPAGGVDASQLQTGAFAGAELSLMTFRAVGSTQMVIGFATSPTASGSTGQLNTPFVVVKK